MRKYCYCRGQKHQSRPLGKVSVCHVKYIQQGRAMTMGVETLQHQQKCKNILWECRYCLKRNLWHGNVNDCTAGESSQSSQSLQSLQYIGRIARDFGAWPGAFEVYAPIQQTSGNVLVL